MLCQDCKKREAQIHLTQIVNNEKASLSLCKECAAARGFHSPLDNVPFPLADILSGMAANLPAATKTSPEETITCSFCGLTFEDFTRQGRFGCGECYNAFRNRLEPIMRKIHGASLHRGRGPILPEGAEETEETVSVREEERLETELKRAIEGEDFERAAELRDKLKTLRESLQKTK
ncbi:MAG: UvrB/UvrC motif-containing protein [Candidatus Zixiibacteriota bacterium]|nr:MAG: UvrB/UvrC motif-containing protein [candidate division Zixibacteria bacterium]